MKGKRNSAGGLFVPGGLLLGMGVGFLTDQLVAGMFIGLGAGFILLAITMFIMPPDKEE